MDNKDESLFVGNYKEGQYGMYGSINVSKAFRLLETKRAGGSTSQMGDIYLNVYINKNKEGADKYGNIGTIKCVPYKEGGVASGDYKKNVGGIDEQDMPF